MTLENEKNEKEKIKIENLLKPEALKILNDVSNYLTDYDPHKTLKCSLCFKKLNKPLHLILWNEDQEHYASFHLCCALKEGTEDLFNELVKTFNYTYAIEKKKSVLFIKTI